MKYLHNGFTLIELVIFIVISSILVTGLWITFALSNMATYRLYQNLFATNALNYCMEDYVYTRRVRGYSYVSGANCTSPLTLLVECGTPAGFTLSGSCVATTIGGDSSFVTITLTITGPANVNTSASILFAQY